MSAVPEVRRRCGGRKALSLIRTISVVIQNDGINGQAGPQLMKAVYEMARKGAQDEIQAADA